MYICIYIQRAREQSPLQTPCIEPRGKPRLKLTRPPWHELYNTAFMSFVSLRAGKC